MSWWLSLLPAKSLHLLQDFTSQVAVVRAGRNQWGQIIRQPPQSSSPREPPPQALTDPYLRLSPHTALHVPCKLPSLRKSLAPPISSWPTIYFWTCQPLRSISITETSSLLRADPPLCSASVLWSLWGFHLDFSLSIGTTGSHVP